MILDIQLCAAILKEKDLTPVLDAHLNAGILFDDGKKCFAYIIEHYQKFDTLPDLKTISEETDVDIELDDAKEPLAYYIEKVVERDVSSTLTQGLGDSIELLQNRDVTEAVDEVKKTLGEIQTKYEKTSDTVLDFVSSTDLRKEWYEHAEELDGGIDGIPTPWSRLDTVTLGWHPGELITIAARLGVGKTFFALLVAKEAFVQGYKPLFVSLEMSTKQLLRRLDAIYTKKSSREIRAGTLGAFGKTAYFEALDKLSTKEDPFWIAGSGSVERVVDLEMMIGDKKPSIVVVDAFYLLQGRNKYASTWERVAEVIRDIKLVAQRKNVPIVVTTQFSRRAARSKDGGEAEDVGYADNILQDSDVGIALVPEEDPKYEGMMKLKMLKIRDGDPKDIRIKWDLDEMDFAEVGYADEDVEFAVDEKDDDGGDGTVDDY